MSTSTSSEADYQRLRLFYLQHAPEKTDEDIRATLTRCDTPAKMDTLWKKLAEKYKVEVPPAPAATTPKTAPTATAVSAASPPTAAPAAASPVAAASPTTAATATTYTAADTYRLKIFYKANAPEKSDADVKATLDKYGTSPETMKKFWDAIAKRYNVPVPAEEAAPPLPATCPPNEFWKLKIFYLQYAPEKTDADVKATLDKYGTAPETLKKFWDAIAKRYNAIAPGDDGFFGGAAVDAAAGGAGGSPTAAGADATSSPTGKKGRKTMIGKSPALDAGAVNAQQAADAAAVSAAAAVAAAASPTTNAAPSDAVVSNPLDDPASPSLITGPRPADVGPQDLRLRRFLLAYLPELSADSADREAFWRAAMVACKGDPTEAWRYLCSQHGPEPDEADPNVPSFAAIESTAEADKAAVQAFSQTVIKARLLRFFCKYEPAVTEAEVDECVRQFQHCEGGYRAMWAELHRRYGPEPSPREYLPRPSSTTNPLPSTAFAILPMPTGLHSPVRSSSTSATLDASSLSGINGSGGVVVSRPAQFLPQVRPSASLVASTLERRRKEEAARRAAADSQRRVVCSKISIRFFGADFSLYEQASVERQLRFRRAVEFDVSDFLRLQLKYVRCTHIGRGSIIADIDIDVPVPEHLLMGPAPSSPSPSPASAAVRGDATAAVSRTASTAAAAAAAPDTPPSKDGTATPPPAPQSALRPTTPDANAPKDTNTSAATPSDGRKEVWARYKADRVAWETYELDRRQHIDRASVAIQTALEALADAIIAGRFRIARTRDSYRDDLLGNPVTVHPQTMVMDGINMLDLRREQHQGVLAPLGNNGGRGGHEMSIGGGIPAASSPSRARMPLGMTPAVLAAAAGLAPSLAHAQLLYPDGRPQQAMLFPGEEAVGASARQHRARRDVDRSAYGYGVAGSSRRFVDADGVSRLDSVATSAKTHRTADESVGGGSQYGYDVDHPNHRGSPSATPPLHEVGDYKATLHGGDDRAGYRNEQYYREHEPVEGERSTAVLPPSSPMAKAGGGSKFLSRTAGRDDPAFATGLYAPTEEEREMEKDKLQKKKGNTTNDSTPLGVRPAQPLSPYRDDDRRSGSNQPQHQPHVTDFDDPILQPLRRQQEQLLEQQQRQEALLLALQASQEGISARSVEERQRMIEDIVARLTPVLMANNSNNNSTSIRGVGGGNTSSMVATNTTNNSSIHNNNPLNMSASGYDVMAQVRRVSSTADSSSVSQTPLPTPKHQPLTQQNNKHSSADRHTSINTDDRRRMMTATTPDAAAGAGAADAPAAAAAGAAEVEGEAAVQEHRESRPQVDISVVMQLQQQLVDLQRQLRQSQSQSRSASVAVEAPSPQQFQQHQPAPQQQPMMHHEQHQQPSHQQQQPSYSMSNATANISSAISNPAPQGSLGNFSGSAPLPVSPAGVVYGFHNTNNNSANNNGQYSQPNLQEGHHSAPGVAAAPSATSRSVSQHPHYEHQPPHDRSPSNASQPQHQHYQPQHYQQPALPLQEGNTTGMGQNGTSGHMGRLTPNALQRTFSGPHAAPNSAAANYAAPNAAGASSSATGNGGGYYFDGKGTGEAATYRPVAMAMAPPTSGHQQQQQLHMQQQQQQQTPASTAAAAGHTQSGSLRPSGSAGPGFLQPQRGVVPRAFVPPGFSGSGF